MAIARLEESKRYVLLSGRLYRQGYDQVLPNPEDYKDAMAKAHVSFGGFHASYNLTIQRILLDGFWWPTLNEDVVQFVQNCSKCQNQSPIIYATLYSITPAPKWSSYIVEYLKNVHIDPFKPTHRRRLIENEAAKYVLIKDQLYHRGKYGNLRLCVPESQYLEILHHAHAGISGGHFSSPTTAKTISWFGNSQDGCTQICETL